MSKEILAFFDILKKPLRKKDFEMYRSPLFSDSDPCLSPILFKGENFYTGIDQYSARSELREQLRFSPLYWRRVKFFNFFMQFVPFVKMVCVCNTLAFDASKAKSDIDLFIVTKSNRLFTARLFMTILLHILGVRRYGSKVSGRFCLSFFVSCDELDLSKILINDKDVYMIFWMRSLKLLFGRKTFSDFLEANKWYLDYFPEETASHRKYFYESGFATFFRSIFECCLNNPLGDFIEKKLSKWQLERAREKMGKLSDPGGTVISETMLKFHDKDRRHEIFSEWETTVSS